ncbi:hypothetical protein DRQ25_15595 [Candidatus Fermentibacteria bacterium]|nr:MAG: hypothetical protein DRQ25_15595 [Candidatus Fermentibacteria bacterium]
MEAVISIDLYLLNHHLPSTTADEIAAFYLDNADGVTVNRTRIVSTHHLVEVLRRQKIADIPAMDVPGEVVMGRRKREMVVGLEAIEEWCKEYA